MQIDCHGQGFKMSPAVTLAWVFLLAIPSPPFFVFLPSVQHSTVQVQQYYTWLISNPAGWETGCRFHLTCQMSKLDNILDRLCAFFGWTASWLSMHTRMLSLLQYPKQWEELWRSVGELIPNKAVCLCLMFCWEGFGVWASFVCAFTRMYTAALLKLHPDIAIRDCCKGNFFPF